MPAAGPFAKPGCRGDNLCRGVWGRAGLIRPDRRPLFLRRRQSILPFPVPRVQAGGNRRLQATARSPNRGAGVITSAAGFGAAQAPSVPARRPLFLRRRQGTLPFPVPRVQAGGNRRLQATAHSPNRGAGVITSAAGFGAAQAPSAPERRPSQRNDPFFLFRGQKNEPKTGAKKSRGPPAIRPERAYQTMETPTRFPENFKKLSGGSKI